MPVELDEIQNCPDGHRCLNGSTCMKDPDFASKYVCDCSAITAKNTPFAGRYCEFGATQICHETGSIPVLDNNSNFQLSFCTNGGKCNSILKVSEGFEHVGCDCVDGYEGDYCEYPAGTAPVAAGAHQKQANLVAPLLITILFILCCAVAAVWFKIRSRRKALEKDIKSMNDLEMTANTAAVHQGEGNLPNVEEIKHFNVGTKTADAISSAIRQSAKAVSSAITRQNGKVENISGNNGAVNVDTNPESTNGMKEVAMEPIPESAPSQAPPPPPATAASSNNSSVDSRNDYHDSDDVVPVVLNESEDPMDKEIV